jgi:hypothetical protein
MITPYYDDPWTKHVAQISRDVYQDPELDREIDVQEGRLHRVAPKRGELDRWSLKPPGSY